VDCGGACLNLDVPQPCADAKACIANADCQSVVCTGSQCQAPTCSDSVKNGNETDIDCGGSCSTLCAPGKTCSSGSDCATAMCTGATAGICMESTCIDGEQNGQESSIDCGGFCQKCPDNDVCQAHSDCQSGKCASSDDTCSPASCDDAVKNGDEVGIDCGGSGCDSGCAVGHICSANEDCESTLCYNGQCLDTLCSDFIVDDATPTFETDVMFDCSEGKACGSCGGACFPCAASFKCSSGPDCQSKVCSADGLCSAASCTDGVMNGAETLTDCGGGCPCATGLPCSDGAHCLSSLCVDGVCAAPTCSDGIQNRQESDADCGDSICGLCSAGKTCSSGLNCVDKVCSGALCQSPSCNDGVLNGNELDTDCGSAAGCGKCAPLQRCDADADCTSAHCLSSVCMVPACDDGRLNGGESDLDCGGPCNTKCTLDQQCRTSSDCGTGHECRVEHGPQSNATCQVQTQEEHVSVYAISEQIQSRAQSGALAQGLGMTVSAIESYAKAATPTIASVATNSSFNALHIDSASAGVKGYAIVFTADGSWPACPAGKAMPGPQVGATFHRELGFMINTTMRINAVACGEELAQGESASRTFTVAGTPPAPPPVHKPEPTPAPAALPAYVPPTGAPTTITGETSPPSEATGAGGTGAGGTATPTVSPNNSPNNSSQSPTASSPTASFPPASSPAGSTATVAKSVITHRVGMSISAAEWPALQASFETGYGLSIGVVNEATHKFVAGATVESSLARRAITASFTATLDPTSIDVDSAKSSADTMTASTLVGHAQAAAQKANLDLDIPPASALVVQPPVLTTAAAPAPPVPGSGDEDTIQLLYFIAGGGGVAVLLLLCCGCVVWLRLRSDPGSDTDEPEGKERRNSVVTVKMEDEPEVVAGVGCLGTPSGAMGVVGVVHDEEAPTPQQVEQKRAASKVAQSMLQKARQNRAARSRDEGISGWASSSAQEKKPRTQLKWAADAAAAKAAQSKTKR